MYNFKQSIFILLFSVSYVFILVKAVFSKNILYSLYIFVKLFVLYHEKT